MNIFFELYFILFNMVDGDIGIVRDIWVIVNKDYKVCNCNEFIFKKGR